MVDMKSNICTCKNEGNSSIFKFNYVSRSLIAKLHIDHTTKAILHTQGKYPHLVSIHGSLSYKDYLNLWQGTILIFC